MPRQELQAEEETLHGKLVRAATERKTPAWKKFKVIKPVTEGAPPKATVDTRRAPT